MAMGWPSYLGLAILAYLAYEILVFIPKAWRLRKFPGPLALPLIGNLWDSKAVMFVSFIGSLSRRYGKFFTFFAGKKPMIVVMDPLAVRQILTDSRTFIKGADYTETFRVGFGEGLVTSNGDRHKHDRACLGKYFIRSNVESRLGMICSHTRKMMDEFLEPSVGGSIDIQHFFHILALRVFGEFALSFDYSKPENKKVAADLNKGVCFGSNVIGEHIVLGIPMWNIIPRVRKLKGVIDFIDEHLDVVVDERMAKRAKGEETPDDVLTLLLDDSETARTRKQLLDQLRTLLAAGHDTTAFFGCYMAYLLGQNPRVQNKAKEEIRRVIGDKTELTGDDINELKYCKMIMQETLRLYSIIPFITRVSTKAVHLKDSGHTIPKDSICLVPITTMNRDPELWENPSEFRPERFESIAGHNSAKHGYIPFGYGARTCVGNTLATIEGTVMIALLLQRYRISPEPGFKPKVIGGISLVSKNGIVVQLEHETPVE